MKRWAFLTISLYIICMTILVIPICLFLSNNGAEILGLFYIYLAPILVLVQIVLLLVPVAITQERPVKKRSIIISAIIAAIPMAIIGLAFFVSIMFMIFGEDASETYVYNWPVLFILGICWLFWGCFFYRNYSIEEPKKFIVTITRWLLRGSILELLVAIPSHIISRKRNDCCAPPITFVGIITGLAIALLAFGPGIYFLFAKRVKNKKSKIQHNDSIHPTLNMRG